MLGEGRNRRNTRRFNEPDRLPWMEAVEEQDVEVLGSGRRRFLLVVGSIIVFALFGSLILYAYNRGMEAGSGGTETAVILANDGPTRVQPQDRGGLNVPNQDRLVFDTLTGQDNRTGENVGQSPEQPLQNPLANSQNTTGNATGNVRQPLSDPTTNDPTTNNQTSNTGGNVGVTTNNPVANTSPATTSPAVNAPITNIPATAFRIQMGAFGSQTSTEAAWAQMQADHFDILGGLLLEVSPLDRPNGTTLYRLRAGPFSSRATADVACQGLIAADQGCFVVSPTP